MRSFVSVVAAAALAGSALSQPIHVHHAHKREPQPVDVDVYLTSYVTDYVTADAAAPTAISSAVDELVTESVSVSANSVYSAPAPAAPPSAATSFVTVAGSASSVETSSSTEAAESTSTSASASASSSLNGEGSAGALGIAYSPYTSEGGCKTAAEVASDLAELTGYDVIRVYGTDCSQVQFVYEALASGQKIFAGVFYMDDIASELELIHTGINGDWDVIHTVNIGNELVNDGEATPAEIGSYIAEARPILEGYGYTGPVVSVDTFIAVIENPDLCQYSDYMAVNAHAFYDGTVTADQAGAWALLQIQRVYSACSGEKSVLITESGWPSQGEDNGVAVPSVANLEAAIASLKSTIGNDVILFSAFNNLWESPGEFEVDQYWGILDV